MRIRSVKKSLYKVTITCFIGVACLIIAYMLIIHRTNLTYQQKYNSKSKVSLRKFPYPFRAAMTISSDLDNTETLEEYLLIHKFLNTKITTKLGKGVGLEIGNSFFFYEPPTGAISYFLSEENVAKTFIGLIQAGYIDTMHSFGKKKDFIREDAVVALRELKKNNCKIEVWVDHSKTRDNFGDDVTFGMGDHPESPAYHADISLAYGIKFVWLGRVTMITGQSVPISLKTFTSIFDGEHAVHSIINITKEFAKNFLAVFGNEKYAIRKNNELVKITTLNDGQKVYEFIRFDKYWQGVATGANSQNLAYVISEKTLKDLIGNRGYMIVYTHLGRNAKHSQYIPKLSQNALRNLAYEYEEGNIYVTTTSKLLNYYINHKYLIWNYENLDDETIIHITRIEDPIAGKFVPTVQNLQGITFYVPDKDMTTILINEEEIANIQRNSSDFTGRESVTIPLTFLSNPLREY